MEIPYFRRKVVAVDFDGVIHRHQTPFASPTEIPDPPVEGAIDFLLAVYEHYEIVIFSARANDPDAVAAIREWLRKYWPTERQRLLDEIYITARKVQAVIYIDDKGFHFRGTFPTIDEIKNFRSWCKV
jgi:hypothetical protein